VAQIGFHNESSADYDVGTVRHYISVVAHKIQVLMRKTVDLGQQDYTSSSPAALSEILIRILSRFLDELRSLSNKAQYQPPGDIIRTVYTINYIIVNIVPELIEAIDTADVDAPIGSVIEAYEEIGNQIHYGTQMIIHPTWEYNASSNEIMNTLRQMTGSLGQTTNEAIFSGAPLHFVILTYPKAEEQNVLRQALIAHEVGHFVDTVRELSKFVGDKQLVSPDEVSNLIVTAQKHQTNEIKDLENEVVQILEEIIANWVQEIVADFCATAIMGPAYLFAFDEISFSPKYVTARNLSLTHPPDRLRKAILGDLVFRIYIRPIQDSEEFHHLTAEEKALFEKMTAWVQLVSQMDTMKFRAIAGHPELPEELIAMIFIVAKKAAEESASILRQSKLEAISDEQWFCGTDDIVDAFKLQKLLSYGLTPTELYANPPRDPSFAAIMNSGWFHFLQCESEYLYFHDTDDVNALDPDRVISNYISLQNLVAKGIESLYFKKEFARRKG
jgi:hypothetical protein